MIRQTSREIPACSIRKLKLLILIFSGWICLGQTTKAVSPSYEEARRLGYELQEEFSQRKSQCIVDRLDNESLIQRAFAAFSPDLLRDPEMQNAWKTQFMPALVNELKSLDSLETLLFSRVLLIEDGRYLEFILLSKADSFHVLLLRLSKRADGKVAVSDIRYHGSQLEYTHTLRNTFILLGVPTSGVLSDEEMTLKWMSNSIRGTYGQLLFDIKHQQPDAAFRQWLSVPDELIQTKYWQDLRLRLVFMGSEAALTDLQNSLAHGDVSDGLVKLSYSPKSQHPEEVIELLDEVAAERQQLPFLRAIKAGALLQNKRPNEALALAQDISRLSPFSASAYYVAICAALTIKETELAFGSLQQWATIMPIIEIEKLLTQNNLAADFIKSEDYAAWKLNHAATAQTVSPE